MSVKKWVMSDEWWVMSDEWLVMEIEWRKLSDEKTLPKQALNLLVSLGILKAIFVTCMPYAHAIIAQCSISLQGSLSSILCIRVKKSEE